LPAGTTAVAPARPRPVDAQARAASGATYRNPVFTRDFPDPMVLKVGRDYYAYGTTTAWEPLDHEFPILHSRDLVHWRYVGDAMTTTPAWSTGDWWAPDVIARTGTY
jgi:beta-xylosidase